MILSALWRTLCDTIQLENAMLDFAINAQDAMPGRRYLQIAGLNAI